MTFAANPMRNLGFAGVPSANCTGSGEPLAGIEVNFRQGDTKSLARGYTRRT